MYQFTREFIINGNEGKLNGKKFLFNAGSDTLMVDHMCNIRKKDVAHIYKSVGHDEVIENFVLNFASVKMGLKKGEVIRLVMTLGQENRVHPLFNDYFPEHTQDFIYETTISIDDEDPTAGIVKAMAAERNRFENLYFTVDSANKVTLMDCYTRLVGLCLVKVPADHSNQANLAAQLTGYQDYEVLGGFAYKNRQEIVGAKTTLKLTEGDAGANTTNYIVQNMRLLTDANINPYGVNMDERPLPKSVYDQFTVEMVTERRHIGHQVMGAIDHSLVTIIFFVIKSESANFESELKKLGTTIEGAKQLPTAEVKATKNNISTHTAPVENIIATAADLKANASADATVANKVAANETAIASNKTEISKKVNKADSDAAHKAITDRLEILESK